MKSIEELVHSNIRDMHPYIPGLQPSGSGWIKLNTNELPYAPPPEVGAAIASEVESLARYPNPRSAGLREALAEFHGLGADQVIVGNGSDDILNLLARAFGGQSRKTTETFPSYSLYPVVTTIAGGQIDSVPFSSDFSLPVDEILESGADLIFLTCPNAPTGIRFPIEALRRLANGMAGILVIDEAYAEFAEESALSLLGEFDRIVITRTFSKAYGLAGLRVGYGMGSSAVIEILDRIRDSYNVNRLSQAGAIAALGCREVYERFIREIKATRQSVAAALTHLGWSLYPSETNFIFAAPVDSSGNRGPEVAAALFNRLKERKILVRYFPTHPLTASHLRISIGSPSEMDRFIKEITTWHKGA